ncbi:autotransporter outer membrane beta-barrel domain-containing protein [Microvirga sp. G4-2]|uniref:autotransporter outer membrane beta-barrel domain-containing protein n=1 Tax=Microvirga sp. G4-2 TaxID=3434467 RepID=UPI00404486CD
MRQNKVLEACTAALLIGSLFNSPTWADTEHVDGTVTVDTPQSNVPYPISPTGTVITDFTSYGGPFPYVMGTFTVNRSGTYSGTLLTPTVQNGFYLVQGPFAPSLGTPSTPLSNVIAFIQDLGSSTMSFSLEAGTVYSYVAIFSAGSSDYTFILDGSGCIALTTTCWIDTSKPYFVETDSRANGETIVFDGGTLRPTTSMVFAQPITLRSGGGAIDTATAPIVTLSGPITGFGGLTINGGNTVILAGLNTYKGGTAILDGRVIASARSLGRGDVLNNGILVFDQSEDGRFAGAITGTGVLTKVGAGRLDLSGTSDFSGTTDVQQGYLSVNGHLGNSLVRLGRDTTLSGNGLIGSVLASAGSTVAPGNSIGHLHVNGDASFAPGSTYRVEVNSAGQADLLTSDGVIRLSSRTTLNIVLIGGQHQTSVPYLIMRAREGIKGRFSPLQKDVLPFVEATLNYTGQTVTLTLKPRVKPSEAGEIHAAAIGSIYKDNQLVQSTLLSRLRRVEREGAANPQDLPQASGLTFWGEALGSWGQAQSHHTSASVERSAGGFLLGAGAQLTPATRLGVAGGFVRDTLDIDRRLASGTTESVVGALYGATERGALKLRLGAGFAGHAIESQHGVEAAGFIDRSQASYSGSTLQGFGEIGYALGRGRLRIEPFLGAAAFKVQTDGFRETGGVAALNADATNHSVGTVTVGAHLNAMISETLPIALNATLGWQRAYGDLMPQVLLVPVNDKLVSRASGAPVDRNSLVAEFGLDWQPTRTTSLSVLYQGQIGRFDQDHALTGNFTWNF